MLIEELDKAFLDKIKQLSLESRLQRAEDKMNQTINIRDLVVISAPDQNCGEVVSFSSGYASELKEDLRLRAHIGFLFDLVTADHRINYCTREGTGGYPLKERYLNHITRLSTAEFFFTPNIH